MQGAEAQLFSLVTHWQSLITAIFLIAGNVDNWMTAARRSVVWWQCTIMGTGETFVFISVIIPILQLLCLLAASPASNCSVLMSDCPSQLCVFTQGNTLSVLRKICYHVCLPYNREVWIEEEEITHFRELWTEKMGGFKTILNWHFIVQWRYWKGLEAKSQHKKRKAKYILFKVRAVVKPESSPAV